MNSLGLYIHIPFCLRKCAYCDFVSFAGMTHLVDSYISALIDEAGLYSDVFDNRMIDTVFLGGGTPTLLSTFQIEKLMNALCKLSGWRAEEITIEANPETLSAEKAAVYADAGINRISIGLQSHDDAVLQRIGRRHTWSVFKKAYEAAAKHFRNINIDTMFALPDQNTNSYDETLSRVIDLSPAHICAYALKLEQGTPLAESFSGADENTDRDMYHSAVERLNAAGYMHYETSNFAKPGYECRHNLTYWTGGEYLGLGVAAHSFIGDCRFANSEDIDAYIEKASSGQKPIASKTMLGDDDRQEEYLMLRLRLAEGIRFEDYQKRFHTDFLTTFAHAVAQMQAAGLIETNAKGIRPTLKGFDLQNTLIGEFLKKR